MANPYDIEAMRAFGLASSNPYDQNYTQYVQDNYTPEELAQAQAALAASRGEAPPVAPVAPEEDVYDVSGLGIEEAAPGDSLPAVQALGADLLQEEQAAPAPQGRISRGQKRSDSVGVSRATPTVVKKRMGPLDVDKAVIDAAATERSQPILAAEKERVKAIRAQENAEIALAEQERKAQEQAAAFEIEEAKAEAVIDAAAHQEAQQRIDQISERVEAVRSMKVDPQRFWTSGSTMHNAAGVLSAFVGGFLQPVLGQNTIQPLLNRFVEQDIDAQKEEIKGARENVSDLRALHALGLQQDEIASGNRAEQRLMRKAGLLGQLEAEVAKYRDPVTRAKADKLVADLQTDFAKEIDTIYEQERTRAFDEMKTKRQLQLDSQKVAVARHSAKTSRMREQREAYADQLRRQGAAQKGLILNPLTNQPVPGRFKDPDHKEGMRDFEKRMVSRAQMTERMRSLMDRMAKTGVIYGGFGKEYAQSEEAQALRGEYEDLRATYIKAMSGAQASDAEVERLKAALPPPETLFTRDPTKTISGFLDRQARDQDLDNNTYLQGNKWDVRSEWGKPVSAEPEVYLGREVEKATQSAQSTGGSVDTSSLVQGALAIARNLELGPDDKRATQMVTALESMPRSERMRLAQMDESGNLVDPLEEWRAIQQYGTSKFMARELGRKYKTEY